MQFLLPSHETRLKDGTWIVVTCSIYTLVQEDSCIILNELKEGSIDGMGTDTSIGSDNHKKSYQCRVTTFSLPPF